MRVKSVKSFLSRPNARATSVQIVTTGIFTLSVSGLPFDDIRDLISNLPMRDEAVRSHAAARNEALYQAFGIDRKEAELSEWLAGWSGKSPAVTRPQIALFAGTHKVAERAASALGETTGETTSETTLVRVTRMAAGGAPINQVCATFDLGLKVFDLALQYPVEDISAGEALDEKGSAATIGFGMEAIAGGVDLLGLAAFGQGDEIANLAILNLLTGKAIGELAQMLSVDAAFVELALQAAELHQPAKGNPLEILRRLGGREHSALLGAILAARVNHVPVVLDGITALAVVTILSAIEPSAVEHCRFAANPGKELLPQTISNIVLSGYALSLEGTRAGQAIALLKSIAAMHTNSVLEES